MADYTQPDIPNANHDAHTGDTTENLRPSLSTDVLRALVAATGHETEADFSNMDDPEAALFWGSLMPCGRSTSDDYPRCDFMIFQNSIAVGKDPAPANDFRLVGDGVSCRQFVITCDDIMGGGSAQIQDKSTTGTWLNGHRIGYEQYRLLTHGDMIVFGMHGKINYQFRDLRPRNKLTSNYEGQASALLGIGGFGTVYKGLEVTTGRIVAIKVMQNKILSNDLHAKKGKGRCMSSNQKAVQVMDALLREVNVMSKLTHPNIVGMLATYSNGGDRLPGDGPRLVLEYMNGGTLDDWCDQNRSLIDEAMYQHFVFQILDGVRYMHHHKIAHRDLKPPNILLTRHDPPVAKIADFGLAKVADSQLSLLHTRAGTHGWTAPEQFEYRLKEDEGSYTKVVDSWGVGLILCWLACQNLPWDDWTQMRAQYPEGLKMFLEANLSNAASEMFYKLLQWDPVQRITALDAMNLPWMRDYLPPVYRYNGTTREFILNRPFRKPNSLVKKPFPRPSSSIDRIADELVHGISTVILQPRGESVG
ncbi:kinase-like protein [Cylindrobasidium torrendii FP15055 ss-10]|uniref:Kinase-like protein n=1 Tax=Cylindrobasidium torrendii FP15055 ss-10 TaxID=1314674 RepID=A0A0D7B8D1_9AGAR|nr:kinase-like protein [Cylindrobasidium torrendii FP15055 ss-10]